MLRVGLLGFTLENANKGCEALTYSFLYLLSSVYKGKIAVRYYSTTELYGQIHEFFPDIEFSFYRLSRKNILKGLKADFSKNCDFIADISFGDGFSDIYNPKAVMWNTLVKQVAGISNVPFVLLPQTYGPFKSKLLEIQAALAIKGADKVFSRDSLSTEYVKKIAGVDAQTVTDLAFMLPYEMPSDRKGGKTKIGINISGLLWKGGFHSDNQFGLTVDYQQYITCIIDALLQEKNNEIHLIPHVIERVHASNDGDLYANDILANKYPSLIAAPAFRNPIETKNYIAQMDVLTAARMHATVDAFSCGVPVIPFAYSRKFEGLYGSVGYDYIVDGKKLTTQEAIDQTLAWLNSYSTLKEALEKSKEQVSKRTALFIEEIVKAVPRI